MDLPTVQQLRYLVSLADNGSFHAAAAACYVSQSTLSTGIKNLETQLGARMVDRSNRVLVFTDVGEEVVTMAREVLEKAADIVRASQSSQGMLTGVLKVGGIPTVLPFVLVDLMKGVAESYPDLSIQLTEGTSDELIQKLQQGRLDLLLLALPYKSVERENLNSLGLFEDPFHLAYHPSLANQVAGLGATMKELPVDRLLLMAEGHCLRGHALDACALRRAPRLNTYEVTSLQTMKGLVDSGIGYTFLPQVAINNGLLEGTEIVSEPVEASRTISLVWRKSSSRDEEFRLFGELFPQSGST